MAAAGACLKTDNPMRVGSHDATFLSLHRLALKGVAHGTDPCQPQRDCAGCHGADLTGMTYGAPSCFTCHGARWQTCGGTHAIDLGGHRHASGYCQPLQNCIACHGANLRGGPAGQPSCYSCHGERWTSCGSHTIDLGGTRHAPGYCQPLQNCSACHGVNLRGGSTGQPSCFSCHGERWTICGSHSIDLGGTRHAPGYCQPYQNCITCHGANLRGGSAGQPSCLTCHDQKKWMNCGSLQHNRVLGSVNHAADVCQPQRDCTPCHGADLRGGYNNEPSCYRCHGAHWDVCSSHTVVLDGVRHAPNYCLPYGNCGTCHGVDLRGGSTGQPSCLTCHDQKKWMNCGSVQHNSSEEGVRHASDKERPQRDCAPCHGANLRGGYNSEPSCYKCHDDKWNSRG